MLEILIKAAGGAKGFLCTAIGLLGAAGTTLFGGWTAALQALVLCMIIDYVTGLIVAGVFHESPNTENGALESNAGFKGLCRKGMILLFVLIGYQLDNAIGTAYLRDAVIIGFLANEVISITENAGLMGLPVPEVIINAIDILKNKGEDE